MDGTMVYLTNPPMLTFGLLPSGLAVINNPDTDTTRAFLMDMLNRMSSNFEPQCRGGLWTVTTVRVNGLSRISSSGPLGGTHVCY